MATQANAATAKGATNTPSSDATADPRASKLKTDVPTLRTVEAILHKNEQTLDGLERNLLTAKEAEQMGQCLKTPRDLVRLELGYLRMLKDYGRKAPVPRNALLRSMIPGLDPDKVAPTDGENVRRILPE